MVSLDWQDLDLTIGETHILRGITAGVEAGQTLAILGPSGSGKTSLLNMLGGKMKSKLGGKIKTITSGTIQMNAELMDVKLYPFSDAVKLVSFVEQEDLFSNDITLWEHLLFHANLRLFHLPKNERHERIDAVLRRLRLMKAKKTSVMKLSGGEKKRVSIAEELLNNPSILMLDEPTSGLDSTVAREVVEILYNKHEGAVGAGNGGEEGN
jgi:ABC-type multidrug transport system ATPase subunit